MAAGTISVKQNASQTLRLHFKDANGVPLDITGKTMRFLVALGVDTSPLVTKQVSSHPDPAAGNTVVLLTASDLAIAPRGYSYQVLLDQAPADTGTFIVEETLGA